MSFHSAVEDNEVPAWFLSAAEHDSLISPELQSIVDDNIDIFCMCIQYQKFCPHPVCDASYWSA